MLWGLELSFGAVSVGRATNAERSISTGSQILLSQLSGLTQEFRKVKIRLTRH